MKALPFQLQLSCNWIGAEQGIGGKWNRLQLAAEYNSQFLRCKKDDPHAKPFGEGAWGSKSTTRMG